MRLIQFEPSDKNLLARFINLPFLIYKNSPHWVPPLRKKQKQLISKSEGMQLKGGPFVLFLLEDNNRDIGRILAGVNQIKNLQRKQNEGYFALFECIDDIKAARTMMDGALDWLKKYNVDLVTGPVSPTNGDDLRGILIDGLDQFPSINTTYTMPYYPNLFAELGFEKYLDFHALNLIFDRRELERVQRIVDYGKNKLELKVSSLNLKDIQGEVKAIHSIMTAAALAHWDHLELPTEKQIREEFESMKNLIEADLVLIARAGGEPVGFVAGIPDYNQVLRHMNGRMTPLSLIKFVFYKRKITRARMFMQFVIPKYQKSYVTPALYLKIYENFAKHGYTEMEGSTIAEFNLASLAAVKGVGFEKSRVYRIYQKKLNQAGLP
jgi:hypothetical protein